jgi:hypothetical protein
MRFVLLSCLLSFAATAHPGHDEPRRPSLSEASIRSVVERELQQLVDAKKIDGSWKGIPVKRLEALQRPGGVQWAATFLNPTQKKDGELFLFANPYGDIVEGGFAMDEAAARMRVGAELQRLVRTEKVAASWQTVTPSSVEKRVKGDKSEWVVVYDNPADVAHPKLFVFLAPWGDFIAANHTGR